MKTTRNYPHFAHAPICAAILLLSLSAAAAGPAKDNPEKSALPTGPAVNLSYMDRSVRPGDDFYDYANGDWIKHTEIPSDRAGTEPALPLADEMDKRVAEIISDAGKSGAGGESRKIADLYSSFMDEKGIEAKGLAPLQPRLAAVAAIKDKRELAHALGETLRADVDALNNTNFHTTLTMSSTTPRTCCRVVCNCRTANITFPTAPPIATSAKNTKPTWP
jgi:predicted metalloendopeptidase